MVSLESKHWSVDEKNSGLELHRAVAPTFTSQLQIDVLVMLLCLPIWPREVVDEIFNTQIMPLHFAFGNVIKLYSV